MARSSQLLLWSMLLLLLLLLACGEGGLWGHRRGPRRGRTGCRQRPRAIAASSGAMG